MLGVTENSSGITFEVYPDKGVQDGIEATVKEGDGFSDRHRSDYNLLQATRILAALHEHHCVNGDHDVIGQPADEESGDQDDGDFQGFALLKARGMGESGNDNAVAGQDDQAR